MEMTAVRGLAGALALVLLAACATAPAPVAADAPHIAAAIADARRPDAERARDAARHPAATLAFAGLRAGQRVADVFPGEGYFTRLFAVAVGAEGRVYPLIRPPETASQWEAPILEVAPQYANAILVRQRFETMTFPEPLDIAFTAQNYHDFHIPRYGFDAAAINRAVYNALKPGGVFVIIDHSAIDGSDLSVPAALHRIDQAIVRREVEAAGFVFDGASDILRNPDDPRAATVFDESIRGRTDQFALRFRKPS
jgi:predicted methyltransferase